jgi:hypothetical protein
MVYLGGTGRRISSLRPAQVKGSETLAQKQTNKQTKIKRGYKHSSSGEQLPNMCQVLGSVPGTVVDEKKLFIDL